MTDAFYLRDLRGRDRFIATDRTRGPWDVGAQHAGPPAALLGRSLGRLPSRSAGGSGQIARVTFEILRPIPVGPLEVQAEVARPGRSVELLEGALLADGEPVMLARAWRIRTTDLPIPTPEGLAPPSPAAAQPQAFFDVDWTPAWHTSVEIRFLSGGFIEPGPAGAWMRSRIPLLPDEPLSPLERVLLVADAGNGISSALDFERFVFINTELSVALHRLPEGEWVHLDAVTLAEPHGIGLATSVLSDERGPIGRGSQALFVTAR